MPTPYPDALKDLEALYALLPSIDCQGHCTDYCGPIALSYVERKRLQRTTWKKLTDLTTPVCPLLKAGRCSVHPIRPLVCRAWGTVASFACPWGCLPERYLSASEWEAFHHAAEEISQAAYPGKGTCSMHTTEVILQIQDAAAAKLCADLWGAG